MSELNFGNVFARLASLEIGDQPALIQGDAVTTWKQLDDRSSRLAGALMAKGLRRGDKVAFYMRNCPAYLETVVACLKVGLVHVNVNYRYVDNELLYILDNSDAAAVFVGEDFADSAERIKGAAKKVSLWVTLGADYEQLIETHQPLASQAIQSSGDDLLFIYTGGTTGLPKAVMWRQADLWKISESEKISGSIHKPPRNVAEHCENVAAANYRERQLAAAPLMHGAGLIRSLRALAQGGTVLTLPEARFDPAAALRTVEKYGVHSITIVGDAIGRPLLAALETPGAVYDLSSLQTMVSTGAVWTPEVKQGISQFCPNTALVDYLGSSEGLGFGRSVTREGKGSGGGQFRIGKNVKVFSEDHREIPPGSEEPGFLARSGAIPLGYYNDPEKSQATFPTINGVRYSIPGDWCRVAEDGAISFLGRGSLVINSGGEKIYPEEVESALVALPGVKDAAVVGVKDPVWGQVVTALLQTENGQSLDNDIIRDSLRGKLAGYKVPKTFYFVADLKRGANGKLDYGALAQRCGLDTGR